MEERSTQEKKNYAFENFGAGGTKQDRHNTDKTPENSKQTHVTHTATQQEHDQFTGKNSENRDGIDTVSGNIDVQQAW